MTLCRTITELAAYLDEFWAGGSTIGFVPTMGALHQGHLSLVERSAGENDLTVVSIFVNPTQFNDPSDLEKYPRTPERDLDLLHSTRSDLVFLPQVWEIYPEPDRRNFDLGELDKVMEGVHRKGHFNWVAQVVTRLFELVRPTRAYFGQKDFQQLVIVQHLVRSLGMEIEIVSCPIVREKDGLAMSSRNTRLTPEQREVAPFIYQTLRNARSLKKERSPTEVKRWVESAFDRHPVMQLEYFEIVEDKALRPVQEWDEPGHHVGCIAVFLGEVRLIDNVIFD